MGYSIDLVRLKEIVGPDLFLDILEEFGGMQFYIPQKESLLRQDRNKRIFDEFTGGNLQQLCRKYGLSYRHMSKIIQDERTRRKNDAKQ